MPQSSASRRTRWASSADWASPRPAAGSSSSSTLGWVATARAMASSRRWPYERSCTTRSRSSWIWNSRMAATTSPGSGGSTGCTRSRRYDQPVAWVGGRPQVVEHRRVLEQLQRLERPRQPGAGAPGRRQTAELDAVELDDARDAPR